MIEHVYAATRAAEEYVTNISASLVVEAERVKRAVGKELDALARGFRRT